MCPYEDNTQTVFAGYIKYIITEIITLSISLLTIFQKKNLSVQIYTGFRHFLNSVATQKSIQEAMWRIVAALIWMHFFVSSQVSLFVFKKFPAIASNVL